jgi:proteasome lid subunit RPN8/RPN11
MSDKKKDDPQSQSAGKPNVSVRETARSEKLTWRKFPGPRNAGVALRVAVDRTPYAELIAHAKESLDVEVCGVVVGQVCEDDEGTFVHIEAIVRGAKASQASTHVTFTQATWNAIHQTLERDYPKLKIVGWYHTHPGFGVEFSDMDLFIQKNFFSGPTQIALVTDPLSGAVAIAVNTTRGIEYLPKFWVDGREQLCKQPQTAAAAPAAGASATEAVPPSDLAKSVQTLEARVSQLVQVMDEQRTSYYRFLMTVGLVFCLAVLGTAAYTIYTSMNSKYVPPKVEQYVPIPIQVGDKAMLVGVGIVNWEVPPEVNATLVKLEQLKQEAAAKEAEAKQGKQSVAPTNTPSSTNSITK